MAECIKTTIRRRRKAVACMTCGMEIARGQLYVHCVMRGDSRIYHWREHMECAEIGAQAIDYDLEGYTSASVAEWLLGEGEEHAVASVNSSESKARIRAWFAQRVEVPRG